MCTYSIYTVHWRNVCAPNYQDLDPLLALHCVGPNARSNSIFALSFSFFLLPILNKLWLAVQNRNRPPSLSLTPVVLSSSQLASLFCNQQVLAHGSLLQLRITQEWRFFARNWTYPPQRSEAQKLSDDFLTNFNCSQLDFGTSHLDVTLHGCFSGPNLQLSVNSFWI